MKSKQLHGSMFLLGVLTVVTTVLIYYGEPTQKTLHVLNFILPATIFTCYFIVVTGIILIRQKIKISYLRYPAEINFTALQGLASLPPEMFQEDSLNLSTLSKEVLERLNKNRSKIRALITGDSTEKPLGRTQQASLDNALEKFKKLLATDL